ncbi:MAG: hypothetical protein R3Y60_03650 [bacterium]
MQSKIKSLSIAGIILFILVIIAKICTEIYITQIVIEDIRTLQGIYGSNIDVVEFLYNNYSSLMQFETVGLSIVLIAGSMLISTSMYLKILNGKKRSEKFNKITATIYAIVNFLAVFFIILSITTELEFIYNVICVLVLMIVTMIAMDIIISFIVHDKSFKKAIQFILTFASVGCLGVGVFFHFDAINVKIEQNQAMVDYHEKALTEYYEYAYEGAPEEFINELIEKHFYLYQSFHQNKGSIIGINYTTYCAFDYMIKRDNEFSLSTDFTVEEKALYQEYVDEEYFNLPLLISLLGGLFAVAITMLTGEGSIRVRREKIKELLYQLEVLDEELKNNEITQLTYDADRKKLFDSI